MRRQNNGFKKIVSYFIVLLILAAGGFVYFSPMFEKNAPEISLNSNGFWNLRSKISVSLYDESGIKTYALYNKTNTGLNLIDSQTVNSKQTKLSFDIKKIELDSSVKRLNLVIEAIDNSKWNLLQGNKAVKEFSLNIDRKRPKAEVVSNTYNIKKGGSAAVVVEVKDENLQEKYITFNNKYKFELIPYIKEGFYAAIIAWPIWEDDFERVSLIAVDKAGNKTNTKVPFYIKDIKIKKDNINISKSFINNVSIPVLQRSNMEVPNDNIEIFLKENRDLRIENISKIKKESLKNMSKEMIDSFSIKPFKRLKGSKTFASFAERRHYFYEGEKIHESWHLGMDWASVKQAPIFISNSGKVIFRDFLGIYGNTLIVDHKLGLQSLYAHTSKFYVQKDDFIKRGQKVANTGSSGAVFGDHLHFGVLVQGIEVNPLEWMDKNWIRTRITNILSEAKQVIRSSK